MAFSFSRFILIMLPPFGATAATEGTTCAGDESSMLQTWKDQGESTQKEIAKLRDEIVQLKVLLQTRDQERVEHRHSLGRIRNVENATQEKTKLSCSYLYFTASHDGKEYAAECKGEYWTGVRSQWECATNIYPGYNEMRAGVQNCASEDGKYEHIPRDAWKFYNFEGYDWGRRAEWLDNGYSSTSSETCSQRNIDDVDCKFYTK